MLRKMYLVSSDKFNDTQHSYPSYEKVKKKKSIKLSLRNIRNINETSVQRNGILMISGSYFREDLGN